MSAYHLAPAIAIVLVCILPLPLRAIEIPEQLGHVLVQGAAIGDAGTGRGGSVSVLESKEEVAYGPFSVSHAVEHYSWSDLGSMHIGQPGRTPWRNLQQIELDSGYAADITKKIAWFSHFSLDSGFESDADNSFWGNATPGLIYEINPTLHLVGGVSLTITSFRIWTWPIMSVNWTPTQNFEADVGFPNSQVVYHINPAYALRLSLDWSEGVYRLAEDSPVASRGYIHEESAMMGAYLDYTPTEHLQLSLGAGGAVRRSYSIYTNEHDKLEKIHMDAAPAGLASITYKF